MPADALRPLIDRLASIRAGLHHRDFLRTWDHPPDTLQAVLLAAEALEALYRQNVSCRAFDGGLAVSIFRDQSTRTRFSFAKAADLLGLLPLDLDEGKSQIAHGETVRETANMISFTAQCIGIRDDIFLGEGHRYMAEVAAAVDEGFRAGVLPQRPAVINLQSDEDHPTQAMADLMHLVRTLGGGKENLCRTDALRGRTLAMTWAYSPSYGKPLSVPQGIIGLMTRFGMNVVLAHPPGYDLIPETLRVAERNAKESGGSFTTGHDMAEAFRGADVVYPKSWAPYRVMQERTRLLRARENDKLAALEREALAANARHKDWECTESLMGLTREGKALYMHCLPADISGVSCPQGEVAAGVFERYRLATYREASCKPFVIAAMILLTRFEDPAAVLAALSRAGRRRVGVNAS